MPMITLTVPRTATDSQCLQVENIITTALRREGVQGGITIWPVTLARVPGRLLLEYKSRQENPDPNHLAVVAAEAAEEVFEIQVEAAVIKLDPTTTGLHIIPTKEDLIGTPPVPRSQLRAAMSQAPVSEIYEDPEKNK